MKRLLLAAILAAGLSAPALAFQCPKDVAEIDAALGMNPDLSAEQLAEVQKLRDEGEAQHKAGNHQGAVDTLAKAKEILGLQ